MDEFQGVGGDPAGVAGLVQLDDRLPGAGEGNVRVAFSFTITSAGRVAVIDLIGEPAVLAGLGVEMS